MILRFQEEVLPFDALVLMFFPSRRPVQVKIVPICR
jgi:hypothetical protein